MYYWIAVYLSYGLILETSRKFLSRFLIIYVRVLTISNFIPVYILYGARLAARANWFKINNKFEEKRRGLNYAKTHTRAQKAYIGQVTSSSTPASYEFFPCLSNIILYFLHWIRF